MRTEKILVVLTGLVCVLALGYAYAHPKRLLAPAAPAAPVVPVVPAAPTTPMVGDYRDATYIVGGEAVTLVQGTHITPIPGSASAVTTRIFGNEAQGDVNGDGREDIAFLLTRDGGGSGEFYYIVVALRTEAGYVGTNAILLGDRIAPQPTQIRSGEIVVNYADRRPTDSFVVPPSVGVSRTFRVNGETLSEVTPERAATSTP